MKILLVWPWTKLNQSSSFFNKIYSRKLSIDESGLPAIISVTPRKYNIDAIKVSDPLEIDYNKKYDLVGITCIIQDVYNCYNIADKFREKKIPVVLGGWHPSTRPEESKEHADSVVIGEAEETWPTLLKDLENGKLKPFYFQKKPVDLTKIPTPKNVLKNRKKVTVMATRGCPYGCKFCAISNMELRKIYRTRPIDEVIDEIQRETSKRFIFGDASLTIDLEYTKKLFNELKGLNKKFIAFGNSNVLKRDDDLLKLASEAGCIRWFVGFESICQSSLDDICKPNKVEDYLHTIKKIHDYGITVEGGFILGFDQDTVEIFDQTYNFLCKSDIDIATLRILTPYPGTPIFNMLDKENRILTKDWANYTGDSVVFQPNKMTVNQLQDGFNQLYYKWHNNSNTIKRILNSGKYGPYNLRTSLYDNLKTSNIVRYGLFKGKRVER